MLAHFLAFLGVSALVIATPRPDTALTIRNTLVGTGVVLVVFGLRLATERP